MKMWPRKSWVVQRLTLSHQELPTEHLIMTWKLWWHYVTSMGSYPLAIKVSPLSAVVLVKHLFSHTDSIKLRGGKLYQIYCWYTVYSGKQIWHLASLVWVYCTYNPTKLPLCFIHYTCSIILFHYTSGINTGLLLWHSPTQVPAYLNLLRLFVTDESPIRKCEDPWDREVPSLQTVIPLETTAAYDMVNVVREVNILYPNDNWALGVRVTD